MKKYIGPNFKAFYPHSPSLLCIYVIAIWGQVACEISTTVPFDLPEYDERLIIHGVASPQSGARALIKYSQPVKGFPGSVPALPDFEAYIVRNGNQLAYFRQDSTSTITDNDYTIQTIFLSISADSLDLQPGELYSMEVWERDSSTRYASSAVPLPPKPKVTKFNLDRSGSECSVSGTLGAVDDPVYAISVKGRLPDYVDGDDYFQEYNKHIFHNDLIYPESTQWENRPLLANFFTGYNPRPDTVTTPVDISVSIAYLSYDIAQLIREIHGTHAIGEDIFQPIRPFHSNFHSDKATVFGVFGLYNEHIRVLPY